MKAIHIGNISLLIQSMWRRWLEGYWCFILPFKWGSREHGGIYFQFLNFHFGIHFWKPKK